jgi:FkbM family methyltransferase
MVLVWLYRLKSINRKIKMKDNYKFTDLEDKISKEEWWQKELKEVQACYRIPMYNLALPVHFRRPPKNCVDIGANVGAFSYYASNHFENVFSYEAVKQTYQVAKDNLQKIKNVKLYNLAVSEMAGQEVKIAPHESGLSGDSSIYCVKENGPFEVVQSVDLDKIFLDNSIDRIDYLKVDCEGSEYPFLMNKNLSKIDFLAIEIHEVPPNPIKKIEELLAHFDKFFTLCYKLGDHVLFYKNKEV